MLRMIEPRVEASQPRESFDARGRVADRADRMLVVGELLNVASRTRHMSRETNSRRIIFTLMAEQARHTVVLRRAVSEPGIILSGVFDGRDLVVEAAG